MGLSDKGLMTQAQGICFTWRFTADWPVLSVTKNINQFGYTVAAFQSKQHVFSDIIHPDDKERVAAEMNIFLAANIESFQQHYRIITHSGEIRDVCVYSGPLQPGDHTVWYSIVHDITQQHQAEIALVKSEQQFRTVIETTSEGFLIVDNHFNITFANHAFCQLSGYELAELKANSVIYYIAPEFKHIFTPSLNRPGIQQHWREDFIIQHKNGQPLNVRLTATAMDDGTGFFAFITNITAHKKAEVQLQKLSRAVEHSASSIMITDKHGIIEYINPRFCEVTGYSEAEAIGQTPSIISTKETPPACHEELWGTILAGKNWHGETFNRTKHGAYYWSLMSISPVMDDQGEISHFISVSEDITTQKDQQIKIEKIALYDPLTGLANRRLLYDRLNQSTEILQRQQGAGIGVIMLDLDHFKAINDTYGHDVGDELLKEVACRLTDCVRTEDTVSRPGGDEFTILLQDVSAPEDIQPVAQKILQSLRRVINIEKYSFKITCSIGISIAPLHTYEPKALLKYADLALYRAKDSGRDNFQFFDANMPVKHQECMSKV
ncbi:bifunctional diguanylate cyclase/phosphodiesterase [Moritella sp. Urea-trap-13]|uniref:sensor domain-containing protein n=1 Tax=Moritella sp. Urea-trap-13 TaxID=2058327 RepID=UPI000C34AE21|nr:sensor domain-containing diguanylate cyclase [Moritella sp. Urea-trap-13]PKH07774.1 sensor domain-containing diguanylate cyclase [Moritella sp. Urea-trap-13]